MTKTEPRERPILFSAPMVRAILDGRKTQTRRVVKPQPPDWLRRLFGPERYTPAVENRQGAIVPGKPIFAAYDADGEWGCKCLWQPGDRLWVRETWAFEGPRDLDYPLRITYRADKTVRKIDPDSVQWEQFDNGRDNWRPSIFMPRWASRITLEVTGVRIERVQEISEEAAEAEGIDDAWLVKHHAGPPRREEFKYLWDSINAKRGFSWKANPWVWVITFERRTTC